MTVMSCPDPGHVGVMCAGCASEQTREAVAAERAVWVARIKAARASVAKFGTDDDTDDLFMSALLAQKEAMGAGAIGMASAAIKAVKAHTLTVLASVVSEEPAP